jgi:hypothetical protein
MAKLQTASMLEQILENMHQLSGDEQRVLANRVLNDRVLEVFVEELDDQLACETDGETAEPLVPEDLASP